MYDRLPNNPLKTNQRQETKKQMNKWYNTQILSFLQVALHPKKNPIFKNDNKFMSHNNNENP